MSRTDKTRPWSVQTADPLNNRFKMVANADYDWYWKVLLTDSCWMCGPKKTYAKAKRSARVRWRTQRQKILALVDKSDVDVAPEKYLDW